MTVVTFAGTHDPGFGRVAILAEGLRRRGYPVTHCVEPVWGPTEARVATARRGLVNPGLALCLARAYWRLARRVRRLQPPPDVLLVGYPGQLDAILLRAWLPRVPLILDGFVSLDETLADRGIGSASSAARRLAATLDRLAFRRADRVIVDTMAHARRFASAYGLRPERAIVAPVGAIDSPSGVREHEADEHAMADAPDLRESQTDDLEVLYFGGFIPLHGVPVMLDAARALGPAAGVRFTLVGDGQDADYAERRIRDEALLHVALHRAWLPEATLVRRFVMAADVCLGIFADRPKTRDVVPAKLYLALACARPVVTGDTPAIREEVLAHAPEAEPPLLVTPPGDGRALADTLRRLRDDRALLAVLGERGNRLWRQRFSPEAVVAELARAIDSLTTHR